jgi:hypothetical protein
MQGTRNLRLPLFAFIALYVAMSAVGLMSGSTAIPGHSHGTTATSPVTAAEPGSKDCSKIKDCEPRCQCEYDQCAAPCGVYERECVKACIKALNTCKDACKS